MYASRTHYVAFMMILIPRVTAVDTSCRYDAVKLSASEGYKAMLSQQEQEPIISSTGI